MSYGKIRRHRLNFKDIPVNVVESPNGTQLSIGNLTSGDFLTWNGTQITSSKDLPVRSVGTGSTTYWMGELNGSEYLGWDGSQITSSKDFPVRRMQTGSTSFWMGNIQVDEYLKWNGNEISSSQLVRPTAHGSIYILAAGEGSYVQGNWTKVSGTFGDNGIYDFSSASSGILTYTGSTHTDAHKHYFAKASLSFSSSLSLTTCDTIDFAFAVDGAIENSSTQRIFLSSSWMPTPVPTVGANAAQVNLLHILTMSNGTYVELYARSNLNTVNMNFYSGTFSIVQL